MAHEEAGTYREAFLAAAAGDTEPQVGPLVLNADVLHQRAGRRSGAM